MISVRSGQFLDRKNNRNSHSVTFIILLNLFLDLFWNLLVGDIVLYDGDLAISRSGGVFLCFVCLFFSKE